METIIKRIEKNFNKKELEEAAQILQEGGLVAFPTETVYGLGGNAFDSSASKKIYRAKGRPSDNPLIVHIADIDDMNKVADYIPDAAYQLGKVFWPGPLTMILKKKESVPYETTGGLDTVAIRIPRNEVARELIKMSRTYIAAPSANTSGRPSPTNVGHVIEDLDGKVDMIIDGGKSTIGLESTIIDLTSEKPVILRPGFITKEEIEKIIGPVEELEDKVENEVAKAPGMKYKHYAPKAELVIYDGEQKKIEVAINIVVKEKIRAGKRVGIIATMESKPFYEQGIVKAIGTRADEETIASGLFNILREFDQLDVEYIYSESFNGNKLGHAIMNRMLKAAGYKVIRV